MDELAAEGAVLADSPQAVAQQSEVVISCVSDSPDVEAVALGNNGIIEGAKAGLLYVDMSTIAPATARKVYTELKAKGIDALDAPVSGGDIGACRQWVKTLSTLETPEQDRSPKPVTRSSLR
jgi:2-hydroxy-3-oxopropionate reductase